MAATTPIPFFAMSETELAYPIGRYAPPPAYTGAWREANLEVLAGTPAALREAVRGLDAAQLDTPYRPGGWTVRQVAHHLPDSHMNAYVRVKLALTEETPTIKPYNEAAWALLDDSRATPVETSLALLESLHDRLLRLLRSLSDADLARRYRHPETGEHDLNHIIGLYAWHGRHHVAHITRLRERRGW